MTDNQNSDQPPPETPPPPTEVTATPPEWADPFVYVEVRGSQGENVERRDIRTK